MSHLSVISIQTLGTSNPYYIEFGWKALNNQQALLPNLDTIWKSDSSNLTPGNSVKLSWTSDDNNTFIINFSIDENYMFSVTQEVINNSSSNLEIYPYRLIKRINTPKTINFFILHEGLISLVNDELLEKNYDDLLDDCSASMAVKDTFCDAKGQGGWLGFTDKYWMSDKNSTQCSECGDIFHTFKRKHHCRLCN